MTVVPAINEEVRVPLFLMANVQAKLDHCLLGHNTCSQLSLVPRPFSMRYTRIGEKRAWFQLSAHASFMDHECH